MGRTSALVAVATATLAAVTLAAPAPPASVPEGEAPMDRALTETYCDLHLVVAQTLQDDFDEEPRLAALTGTGLRMEFWASDLLGTWTLVHHGQDGISCIVTSGMDWQKGADAPLLMRQALAASVHQP
jgi:hypothetical protein